MRSEVGSEDTWVTCRPAPALLAPAPSWREEEEATKAAVYGDQEKQSEDETLPSTERARQHQEREVPRTTAAPDTLQIARKAAARLQSATRRLRWIRALSKGLSMHRAAFCGVTIFPIRNAELDLVGFEGPSGRRYVRGGCALQPDHPLRLFCISVVETATLERSVLVAILSNCLFLAVQGPPGHFGFLASEAADKVELGFTLFFTVELVLKMVALGGRAYMSDTWNGLDLVVVVSAWVPLLLPALGNVSAMRAVRALRPLRTVNRLPGMRSQVNTLIGSLPALGDVLLLSAFFLVVGGVLGVQLFAGQLRYRCYRTGLNATNVGTPFEEPSAGANHCSCGWTQSFACPGTRNGSHGWSRDDGSACFAYCCPPSVLPPSAPPLPFPLILVDEGAAGVCASNDGCAAGEICQLYGENPQHGTLSFDTILQAWMTLTCAAAIRTWPPDSVPRL